MSTPMQYPKENQGPTILGATLTVTIAALITFIVRVYVRVRMIRNVGWDDYIMASSMLLCVVGQIIIIPEVYLGAGRHLDQIDPDDFQQAFKLNFVTQPIYLFAIMLVKQSVGFFLLRIAATPFYRRTIISIMIFMAVYTFGCFLTIVLQCTNLTVLWDPAAIGTCWTGSTLKALSYTNVSLNVITDLLFAIFIPIPMLWHVQMNRRQKSSIVGILALGIFATAAALVRISYLVDYGKTGDWLWDSRSITIWTVAECNVGIVAGNLPCLKPLFRTILGSTYGRGTGDRTNSKYLPGAYGPGTHHKSVKNYNSLGSRRTEENEQPFGKYGVGEAHMMTDIGVGKERSGSPISVETPGKNSQESLVGRKTPALTFGDMGGIRKTTVVNVTGISSGDVDSIEDGSRPRKKETHIV